MKNKLITKTDKAWIKGYLIGVKDGKEGEGINRESANFIKWTITTLGDEDYFQYVIRRINDKQKDFYSGDRKELLKTLENKMEKGAIEHGNPIHNFKLIEKEFKDEMLDLIGWMMLYAWALNKEYGK